MTIALLFWILMVIWAVSGAYVRWGSPPATPYTLLATDILIFVLFLLLGIAAFGWPIKV